MRVVDAHRVLGPVPTGPAAATVAELLAELDHLGIDRAAVTPAWSLHGDPRSTAEYEALRLQEEWPERLLRVPVVIPAAGGAGWPESVDDVATAPLVRACPQRHRFELLGPRALELWHGLARHGVPLALDASECSLPLIGALAAAVPTLRILALTPGYRELRRLAELLETAPGVWVETGTIVSAGAVEWLARLVGAHRLVFGTGAPFWDDAGPRFQLDHLDLPESDVALIASGSWELLTAEARP